jgi:hypothetical protein
MRGRMAILRPLRFFQPQREKGASRYVLTRIMTDARKHRLRDMQKPAFRVLLVDDDEGEYVTIKDMLAGTSTSKYDLDRVDTYEDGLRAICQSKYDVILIEIAQQHGGQVWMEPAAKKGTTFCIIHFKESMNFVFPELTSQQFPHSALCC